MYSITDLMSIKRCNKKALSESRQAVSLGTLVNSDPSISSPAVSTFIRNYSEHGLAFKYNGRLICPNEARHPGNERYRPAACSDRKATR